MKVISFTAPQSFDEITKEASKMFNGNRSSLFRKNLKYLVFLYDFMNDYMQPNKKKPPEAYLDKIDKIGALINVIKK